MPRSFLSDGDLALGNLSGLALLFHINSLLSCVHLDVGLGRKIGADSSVGSVCSSSALCSSIDLDVIDGEVFQIFDVGVCFKVVNKAEDNLD